MSKIKQTLEVAQEDRDEMALIEFRVGPYTFCAPAIDVEAIIQPPEMTPVPLGSKLVAGCFVYQGRTATVICLNTKLGITVDRQEQRNESHIILSEVNDGLKGFWVDKAKDIEQLEVLNVVPDFCTHELKAYDGFLLRKNDILLQTTFERLYRCARSRMHWKPHTLYGLNQSASTDSKSAAVKDSMANAVLEKTGKLPETDTAASISANQETTQPTSYTESAALTSRADKITANNSNADIPRQAMAANTDFISHAQTGNGYSTYSITDRKSHNAVSNRLSQTNMTNSGIARKPDTMNTTATPRTGALNKYAAGTDVGKAASDKSNWLLQAARSYHNTRPLLHSRNEQAAAAFMPEYYSSADNIPGQGCQTDAAADNARDENNKGNMLPLIAVLLALTALGLGTLYILEDEATPVIAGKTEAYNSPEFQDVGNTETDGNKLDSAALANTVAGSKTATTGPGMDTADQITAALQTPPMHTVNEVDQTTKVEAKGSGRVIEINLTAIEPVNKPAVSARTHDQYAMTGTREFIHLVLKGETLWYITKRYLGNPFLYPELAESSHIRNPHLIYPGDVIRIVIKNRKK